MRSIAYTQSSNNNANNENMGRINVRRDIAQFKQT